MEVGVRTRDPQPWKGELNFTTTQDDFLNWQFCLLEGHDTIGVAHDLNAWCELIAADLLAASMLGVNWNGIRK